jgi:hypothetical protein
VIGSRHATLAGEAIALAHERVAEWSSSIDRGRGNEPGDELDAARRAAPRPPQVASMVPAPPCAEASDGRACIDLEGVAGRKQGQRYRRHFLKIPLTLDFPERFADSDRTHEPLGASGPQVIREARCSTTPSVGFSGDPNAPGDGPSSPFSSCTPPPAARWIPWPRARIRSRPDAQKKSRRGLRAGQAVCGSSSASSWPRRSRVISASPSCTDAHGDGDPHRSAFPVSLLLGSMALVLAVPVGVTLGVLAAV